MIANPPKASGSLNWNFSILVSQGESDNITTRNNIISSSTVVKATVVKAVGMWGAINQPASYPARYEYMPSAVVTASFTGY